MMKTSAIIRIVIWSLVALLLVGILLTALAADAFRFHVELGETAVSGESDGTETVYRFDPEQIRDIQIEWVDGSITVVRGDVDEITVSEPAQSGKWSAVCSTHGSKLTVEYCKGGFKAFSLFEHSGPNSKALTVTVPQSWDCGKLEISSVSADIEILDQDVDTLRLDNVSGRARFRGTVKVVNCDTISGGLTLECGNTPDSVDFDGVSADLNMILPEENEGFTVDIDSTSGRFVSDFDCTMDRDQYCFGGRKCGVNVDTVSGNVSIRRK